MDKDTNTLAFAMQMIGELSGTDSRRAAEMAVALHRHEAVMERLDRVAEGVAALVAANLAASAARAGAREEREERESASRITEIEAREAREERRRQEDHELRVGEIRARQAQILNRV